mgnify:FL=1
MQNVRLYDASANVLKGQYGHPKAVFDCCFHDDNSGFSVGVDAIVKR